ncbi:MAG: hypothetical protein KA792_06070, partial [Bacteroidales bacterium]|nr:hypothetical protein [Bacteroidales bacterium]
MKKLIFISLIILVNFGLYSQPYQISFAGTGASNNVESVKVHNLTKDLIVELAGTDILQLVLSSGIND